MAKKKSNDLVDRRNDWLEKRGLSIREFADACRLDYNTAHRWFYFVRKPQRLYAERIAETFTDFPMK